MVIDPSMLAEVLGHLASSTMSIAEAKVDVPPRPGLYAVHGDTAVWRELGLGEPTDARPLYVGKAERSLASRDVDTHFSTGRTGSSTLRRSLAGLLADQLALKGDPRNPAKPERSASRTTPSRPASSASPQRSRARAPERCAARPRRVRSGTTP